MKKFIYTYVLKPKSEREQTDMTFIYGVFAVIGMIVLLSIGHAFKTVYIAFEQYNITDSCRTIGIVSDGKNYICKSFLHNGKYYEINKNIPTNMYVNRKIYINDNGTYNTKTYDYKFNYVALTEQKRNEINGK